MRRSLLVLSISIAAGLLAAPGLMQGGASGPTPYDAVEGWLKPFAAAGYSFGATSSVFADSADRIFIAQRGENRLPTPVPPGFQGFLGSIGVDARTAVEGRVWRHSIFVVDGDGNMTDAWTQWDDLFATDVERGGGIHKIKISPYDADRKLWVADVTNHQVHAFSNDGAELVLSLGAGGAGADEMHLDTPWDMAFLADGSIFVADSGNARIVKYDNEGNYLTSWGTSGSGRGEFDQVHAVATDSIGRIYVADRDNQRIQVFNETTRSVWYHPNISPIATWPGFQTPTHIYATGYDVWISDNNGPGNPARLVKLDWNGNPQFSWTVAGLGAVPGEMANLHQFSADVDRNLYMADPGHGRIQKFVPREGASVLETVAPPASPEQ